MFRLNEAPIFTLQLYILFPKPKSIYVIRSLAFTNANRITEIRRVVSHTMLSDGSFHRAYIHNDIIFSRSRESPSPLAVNRRSLYLFERTIAFIF